MSTLERWINGQVGRHRVLNRHDKGHRKLVEIADISGRRWFAKQVDRVFDWNSEMRAYRNWTPALGDSAPTLQAANADLRTLLLSAVSGAHPSPGDRAANRKAGRVLRMLHQSQAGRPSPAPLEQRASKRLEALLARHGSELFSDEEMMFAREETRRMASLQYPAQVPCHGDFMPYNWLVDGSGTLRVIDFGRARWHVPPFDFTRLYFGPWWERPNLAIAFLRGYGRALDRKEQEFIQLHLVTNAVVRMNQGHTFKSRNMLSLGRERLHQLMAGHSITGSS